MRAAARGEPDYSDFDSYVVSAFRRLCRRSGQKAGLYVQNENALARQVGQRRRDSHVEFAEIALDDSPDEAEIDAEVRMGQAVPHPSNLLPRYLGTEPRRLRRAV
jgi:hypothetical protein